MDKDKQFLPGPHMLDFEPPCDLPESDTDLVMDSEQMQEIEEQLKPAESLTKELLDQIDQIRMAQPSLLQVELGSKKGKTEAIGDVSLMRVLNLYLNVTGTQQDDIRVMSAKEKYASIQERNKSVVHRVTTHNHAILGQIKDYTFNTGANDEEIQKQSLLKVFKKGKKYFKRESQNNFSKMPLLEMEFYQELYRCEMSMFKEIQNQFIEVEIFNQIKDILEELERALLCVTRIIEVSDEYKVKQKEKQIKEESKQEEEKKVSKTDDASEGAADSSSNYELSLTKKSNNSQFGLLGSITKSKQDPTPKKTIRRPHRTEREPEDEDEEEQCISTEHKNRLQSQNRLKMRKNSASDNEQDELKVNGNEDEEEDEDDQQTMKNKRGRKFKSRQMTQTLTTAMNKKRLDTEEVAEEDENDEEDEKADISMVESTFSERMEGTVTRKLQIKDQSQYDYYQEKRLFVVQIVKDFKEIFLQDEMAFIQKLTLNQVVKLSSPERRLLKLNEIKSIKDYIKKNSHNYSAIEEIKPLGEGGESQIFRMKVFQPVEIVAKTPLPPKGDEKPSYQNIMMESHMIKLLADPEYIAEIVEEIIEYDSEKKEVINYIVIVEKAIHDLSNILLTWTDEKLSKANQEEFSQEKLAYFCLKAMEAMHYCHSNNVYYGDMKPPNLLVFRDMSIKLGDFGISIKLNTILPNTTQVDLLDTEYNFIEKERVEVERQKYLSQKIGIKGLTKGYTLDSIVSEFEDNQNALFSYEKLLLNDYYSLRKTFEKIADQFKSKIKTDSIFYWMVKDLKELNTKTKQLEQVLHKWRSIISNDKTFITTLCDQIISEEKFQAIPNILKLSKYRNMFLEIQLKFKEEESVKLQYTKSFQYQNLEEDASKKKLTNQVKLIDPFEAIYIKEKLYKGSQKNLQFLTSIIADIEPYLYRLCSYVGALEPSYYKDFYYEHFSSSFLFDSDLFKPGTSLTRENFNFCPISLLRKVFTSKKEDFVRFAYFIVSTTAAQDTNFQNMLLTLINFSVELELEDVEFDLIYAYNRITFLQNTEQILKNKFDFAFRSKELCTQLKYPYDKAIQCYIYAIKCMKDLRGEINSYEIKFEMQKIKSIAKFNTFKKKSYYSLYYSLMAQSSDVLPNLRQRIGILEKERVLYSKVYGEQGEQMVYNGYQLYQCHKELNNIDKQNYYLSKIITYSNHQKKLEYLGYQIHDQMTAGVNCDGALEQLKDLSDVLCSIILVAFPELNAQPIIADTTSIIRKLLNLQVFESHYLLFNNSKSIYHQSLLKVFGKLGQKEFDSIYEKYNVWANFQYQKFFQEYEIKQSNKVYDVKPLKAILEEKGIKNFKISSSFVEVIIPDMCIYIGQISEGKFNGRGISQYADGRMYVGKLKDGVQDGKGRQYWKNNTTFNYYKGKFENDQFEGLGALYFTNGDVYEGMFHNGFFHGSGKLTQGKQIYEGAFSNNSKTGEGKQIYANSGVYEGSWKSGKRKGHGKYFINTEDEYENYEGEWNKDQKNGQGKQIYRNKDVYDGSWSNGMRNGYGILTTETGLMYKGEWKDNHYEGEGQLFQNSKLIYDGLFFRDQKVKRIDAQLSNGDYYVGLTTLEGELFGQGKLTQRNGDSYEGEFKKNQKHGKGVLKMKNGDTFDGEFVKDMKSGVGLYILSSGIQSKVQYYKNQQAFYKEINKNDTRYEGTTCFDKKQGYGVYQDDYNETKYIGNFVNDLMEGEGVLTYSEGDKYEGSFLKGLRHGFGKYTFKNGDFYIGYYERDLYNGEGTLSKQRKSGKFKKVYQGGFKNGVRHGFGILKGEDSEFKGNFVNGLKEGLGVARKNYRQVYQNYMLQYEGTYKKNKWNGPGRLIELEQAVGNNPDFEGDYHVNKYEGIFKDGKKQGIGKIFRDDKLVFSGAMLNNKMHGFGTQTFFNGCTYTGDFMFNKKNGKGEWVEPEKYTYVGQFKNDKKSGKGVMVFANGDAYDGQFIKDEISGFGKMIYADKSVYEGDFKKGKRHGEGKYVSSGSTFEGFFKNNEQLKGTITFQSGDEYKGEFKGLKMHGYGIYKYKTGEIFEGEFVENKRMNKGKFTDNNQNSYEGGILKNNFKHGFGILKYTNGTSYEGHFVKNVRQGHGKFTLANGEVEYEGQYKNEMKHGKGKQIFEDEVNSYEYEGEFYHNLLIGSGSLTVLNKSTGESVQRNVAIDFDCKLKQFYYSPLENDEQYPLLVLNKQAKFENLVLTDSDQNTYIGESLNNIKFGSGKLNFKNGDYYTGQFWKDKMHGSGNYVYANGSMYKGSFVNNERHGKGFIIYENGDQFSGSFKGGFRDGEGIYKSASSDEYIGVFMLDLLTGEGIYKGSNKLPLQGTYKPQENVFVYIDEEKNEEVSISVSMYSDNSAKEVSAKDHNGNFYVGQMKNRQKHGKGTLNYADKSIYVGFFENGKRIEGTLTLENGEVYYGKFVDDQLKGHVQITYNDKSVYEGQYDTNMRMDQGKMTFANGDVYEGNFLNDQMQGEGMMKFANGDEYHGEFLFGMMHGKGLYTFKNGDKFKGEFMQGQFQDGDYEVNEANQLGEGKFENLSDFQKNLKNEIRKRIKQNKKQRLQNRNGEEGRDYLRSELSIQSSQIQKSHEDFQSTVGGQSKNQLFKNTLREDKDDGDDTPNHRRSRHNSAGSEVDLYEQMFEANENGDQDNDQNDEKKDIGDDNLVLDKQMNEEDFEYQFGTNGKLVHTGILQKFLSYFEDEDALIEAATKNQTIAFLDKEIERFIETDLARVMEIVIKKYSKYYRQLDLELEFLTQGEDCQIYKSIKHNLIVRISKSADKKGFITALEEIQMKFVLASNFVTEVSECVIIYSKRQKVISLIFEITELAQSELQTFLKFEPSEQAKKIQSTKLLFYYFQVVQSCYYFHQKHVSYCEFTPSNTLIFKNYQAKYGDFGLSIKYDQNSEAKYTAKGACQGFSSTYYHQAYDSQQLLTMEDLQLNDFHSLQRLGEELAPFIIKSELSTELLRIANDAKHFVKNVQIWEQKLTNSFEFQNSLLEIAENEGNAEAYNFIKWCISVEFKCQGESYSQFCEPINRCKRVLNIFNVYSIQEGFLHIFVQNLNTKFRNFIKILSDQIQIARVSSADFMFKDFKWLGDLLESSLKLSIQNKMLQNKYDWDNVKKEICSQSSVNQLLILVLTFKLGYTQTQAIQNAERLKSSKVGKEVESVLEENYQELRKQVELIQSANLEPYIQKYAHNNQIFNYDKLVEFSLIQSDFSATENVKSFNKKIKIYSEQKLSIISSQIESTLKSYDKYSEHMSINAMLGLLIQAKPKHQALIESEINKALLSEFKPKQFLPQLMNLHKALIVDCMTETQINTQRSLCQSQELTSLLFIQQLMLITTPVPLISAATHFFSQKKYAEARDFTSQLIQNYVVRIEEAFALLPENPDFTNLKAILDQASQNGSYDFKFKKQLNSLFVKFQTATFISSERQRKNKPDGDLKTKMNEYLKQILKFDIEKDGSSNEESSGKIIQFSCPVGCLLNNNFYRNDLQLLASLLSDLAQPNLKEIYVYQIHYVEQEHQIKAIKIVYAIEEDLIETSWHGQPLGSTELAPALVPYVETITFENYDLSSIQVQRNFNIGLKFTTGGGKSYTIGNYIENEKASRKEEKKGGQILWLETGFMPVDVDYPDEEDQVLYHIGYYWIDTE